MIAGRSPLPARRGRFFADTVRVLAERYVKVRYRGSVLGIAWSLLNPVIMTAVYAVVFGRTFRPYYHGSLLEYAAALFVGLVAVNFFSASTTQALQSVVGNGLLLNKMRLPCSAFPVATVLATAVQLGAATVPALLLIAIVVARNPFGAPLVVVPLAALLIFCLGVGLILSSAYVFFRDIPHLYELLVFIIFVATPVFYPLAIVAEPFRHIIAWNPLALTIEVLRAIVVFGIAPSSGAVAAMVGWALAAFAAGVVVFRSTSRVFMDYL